MRPPRRARRSRFRRRGTRPASVLGVWASVALLAPSFRGPVLEAQDVTGEIAGRVVDPGGGPLEGVAVTVTGPSLLGARTAATSVRGTFRLPRLPVGTYAVRMELIGRRSVVHTGVRVDLGRTTSLAETTLPVEAVPLEPIQVEAAPLLLDPTRTSLGSSLPARVLERLPTARDYVSLLHLLPQADESFLGDPVNVAGSTGLENAYHVEGVNVTDLYRGRGGTALPYDFIRAVELKRGGYQAEYGGALGGVVNVVTHSGGPEWRATGFGYFTGSDLSADPRSVPGVQERGPSTEWDAGVSLGGPLVRDRLWVFSAYNPGFVREDVALPGLEVQEARITRHVFATKLDWRASDALELTLTAFGDPSTERRVQPPSGGVRLLNPDPVLSLHREGGVNVSLRGAMTPRPDLLVEASLARHRGREDIEGATELGRSEPTLTDRRNLPEIVLSGGQRDDQALDAARTSLKLAGTLFTPRHRIKAGLEYQDNRLDLRNDESPGQIFRISDSLWQASFFVQDFTVRNRVATAFLQDSWAVTHGLRLNVGLRWDGQYLVDQDGHVGQRLTDQIQPRIGVVWQPGEAGRQKVFAHVGRFYQQLALHWASLALAGFDQRQAFFSVDPRRFPDAADSTRILSDPATVRGGVDGLEGEHHDEVVAGYERLLGSGEWKVGIEGTYRVLRASITSAFRPDGTFTGGNPGQEPLGHLPGSEREYRALQLSLEHRGHRLALLGSWVLSRNRGNYPGLYAADAGGLRGGSFGPNNNQLTYFPAQGVNADGVLPNDRTHVLKLSGAYDFDFGLTLGSFLVAQSGTVLSDFGRVPGGFNTPLFLAPRGSEGRSPAVWNLSLRLAWRLPTTSDGRVVVDLLHVGSSRTAVRFDQRRYSGARGSPFDAYDTLVGNQVGQRPSFLEPVAFQPPFTLRLGMELGVGL